MADESRRVAGLSADKLRRLMSRLTERQGTAAGIPRAPRDGALPVSFAQERLWFLDRLGAGGAAYHIPAAVRLRGPLDDLALERTLEALVERHEALRTTFGEQDGRALQIVHAAAPLALPRVDLAALSEDLRAHELARISRAEAVRPFDLTRGPLLRAVLVRLGTADHVLALAFHHIITDGWSLGVLVREVAALYPGFAAGRPAVLAELPVQPADHAVWERERLRGATLEKELSFWRERLEGLPPLELPADRPRPAAPSHRGALATLDLPPATARDLEALAQREKATPFMALLALFQTLLLRYSGQSDFGVGTPVANRTRSEVEGLIGLFVNPVVLRVDLSGNPGFAELLRRAREVTLAAFAHEEIPFEKLVEELRPEREAGRNPLFQVLFTLQNQPWPKLRLGDLDLELAEVDTGTARADLTLIWRERDGGLTGTLEHSTDLFERASAERLLGHLAELLHGALADPEQGVWDLPLLNRAERAQILEVWRGSALPYPRGATVHELVAEQAAVAGDRVAVEAGDASVTYAELESRANQLAHHLRRLGVGPDCLVGLAVPRSPETVVGLLGILKAGGAYLPLDPTYPRERLDALVHEARPRALVTLEPLLDQLPGGVATVCLDRDRETLAAEHRSAPAGGATADNLVYVLYTSGSTGQPKGVAVPHRGVTRLVRGAGFARLDGQVFLQLAPLSFDASTLEIWGALCNGGRLVLAPPEPPSLAGLGRLLARYGVTTLWLTAGLFHQMVDEGIDALRGLSQLLAGGDVLSPLHVRRAAAALPGCALINGYGPTENTTFTCCHPLAEARTDAPVPIGRPIGNTTVVLLDRAGRPVPVGVPGELHAGGDGLARGYLGRPDLTAERFVPSPLAGAEDAAGARLYRTGDLARWRPDGALDFLGRIDQQVKIRGFRIEPGEIEAALASHPGVAACAVVVHGRSGEDRRLIAWLVPREDAAPEPAGLRAWLAARLPAYMVPAAFGLLDALPLNANGKVDRRALARLQPPSTEARGAAPETPLEIRIAALWSDLLGQPRIGRDDDFFALGGHSLLATRVVSRLREELGVELPLVAVFENPTLAGLAAVVGQAAGGAPDAPDNSPIPAAAGRDEAPLSFSQERLWFLEQLQPGSATYNIPAAVRLSGPLDPAVLAACFGEIIRRHAALRTTFPDPGGEPRQRIAPAAPVRLPRVDLGALPEEARSREAGRLTAAEAAAPFDLAAGPLLRTTLLRLGPEEHLLLLTVHHIVADGWSVGLLIREMASLFEASALPELPIQYADFAVWQRRRVSGAFLERELGFWSERLRDAPAELALPTDRPRPAMSGGRGERGASRRLRLRDELATEIRRLALSAGATPFMVLLSAYAALLSRLSGQTDLTIGTPVAGRQRAEVESLIGFFVNTLVLRADLADAPSFAGLLARTRRQALEAFAHQELPFEKLVEHLQPGRPAGHNPLFQVLFALQSQPWPELRLGGLRLSPVAVDSGTAKADLTLVWHESEGTYEAVLEFSTDLFEGTTAERLLRWSARLLGAAVADPAARLAELPVLDAAEQAALLEVSLGLRTSWPREATIPALVREQVRRTPEAVAVEMGAERLTYAGLEARAHRLAHRLLALGVRPDDRVGLAVERSADLVVGMLGILAAGGAYVPLDLSYPQERLDWMAADAGISALVHRGGWQGSTAVATVDLGDAALAGESPEPPPVNVTADHLAYVIYTSGSTGRPKGVAVPHRAVVRLLIETDYVRLEPSDRVAQVSNVSFDAATFEVWGALFAGARLVGVPREEAIAPEALARRLAADGITALFLTTALFNQVARHAPGAFRDLRHLLFGGEAVDPGAVREVLARGRPERLLHVYGPTETTTFATWHEVEELPAQAITVPIGRPLANSTAWVVDAAFELAPPEVPGELLLGGDGLARGYGERAELTAERFVPHPWSDRPGDRLYRTGDLVRRLEDGALEFLGRIDQQVKIRGFRIEPGEIEAALGTHPEVAEQAVVVLGSSSEDRRLVAWIAPREGAVLEPAALRSWIAARLPAYMVPAVFAFLPTLPLNANGKVDRRALARLQPPSAESRGAAPETPLERRIAAAWSDLLGQPRIGRDDDFFALGGHSLLATRVISRLRAELDVELPLLALFENPTLAGLAAAVAREGEALPGGGILLATDGGTTAPLSFAQERLWFLDQLQPGSAAYNVPAAVRLAGALDPAVLAACFGEIVRRHAALRTTFPKGEGEPRQQVAPAAPVGLPLADLAGLPEEVRRPEALRLAAAEATAPFDLAAGPLLRTILLRLGADEHLLLLTMHHIVADGWSIGILVREAAALYAAFAAGQPSPLPDLPVQYADFALWQRRRLSGALLDDELRFWSERLRDAPAELALPADRARPALVSERGASCRLRLAPELSEGVRALAREAGATPFMVLLAAFETLLSRLSGQSDLTVGTPVAGRQRAEIEGLIGFFINTLVLRADLADEPSFAGLLARTRRHALEAFAHQELPFEKLVEQLQPGRHLGRTPLFQASFVLQNAPAERLRLPGLAVELLPVDHGIAKFDLTLALTEYGDGFAGELIGSADLFEEGTIRRWAGCFEQLLAAALRTPGESVFELPLLAEAERRALLDAWSVAEWEPPTPALIHEIFAEQAARTPDKVAAVCRGEALTYRELDERSSRLARRIAGFADRALVGLMATPDLPLLVGMLGILKAGSGFVPLDPDLPAERLERMAADCGLAVIAADRRSLERCPAVAHVVCLEDEPEPLPAVEAGAGDGTAYVIFTSGSTGVPKGVPITHENLVPLLLWSREVFGFGERTRVLQSLSYAFDFGVFEILTTLLFGGTLHPRGEAERSDVEGYLREVREHAIDTLHTTPSFFRAVAAAAGPEGLPTIRVLHLGGEALGEALVTEAFAVTGEGCRVFNGYGPTEAAVNCALQEVGRAADWRPRGLASLPIGRPSALNRLYVLDRRLHPVPVGVPGELLVGGPALSRGYLGRPDLTAARFIPDPFGAPGGRLYRTGDLVRFHTDRAIEFLGRVDNQVKVRGYRIELEEIEAALAAHPGVGACAVVAVRQEGGEARLLAYVAPRQEAAPSADELRRFLGRTLPAYMVPAAFTFLPQLPLNVSGKVDRKALPAPDGTAAADWVAPRNPLEELLAGLWEELLGRERVGVRDDFFELGGHSLLATRMLARVRAALGVDLPVLQLFEAPTVEELTAAIESARGGTPLPALLRQPRRPGEDVRLSFAQERLWFLDQLDPGAPTYNMPGTLGLTGRLDVAALAAALRAVVARHEVLRTVFPVVDGEPRQRILAASEIGLPLIDLAALPPAGRHAEAERLAAEHARRSFDLARGPLLDAALLRLDAERHHLLVVLHHVICDGWSLTLLMREIGALHTAFASRRPSPLHELLVQYADFAVWQREVVAVSRQSELAWWLERLGGEISPLELPTDRPRPAVQTFRGGHAARLLPPALAGRLSGFGRAHGATLFMTLLAAIQALLHRHSGQDDILLGAPVAGRRAVETEELLGCFLNTLVLRTDLGGQPGFADLVARVREVTLGAYSHQDVPFEAVLAALPQQRDLSRTPLFQVMVNLLNLPAPEMRLPGLEVETLALAAPPSKLDMTFYLNETDGGVGVDLVYNADLFDAARMEDLLAQLEALLDQALERPAAPVGTCSLVTAAARAVLPDPAAELSAAWEGAVHEVFARHARQTPGALAVTDPAESWTYGELDERSSRLAAFLRASGVRPGDVVAFWAHRSAPLVWGVLGALKAGAAFLMLDPRYPAPRQAQMLGIARPAAWLRVAAAGPVPAEMESKLDAIGCACRLELPARAGDAGFLAEAPAGAPAVNVGPDAVAYVAFTSGSTGVPKGVLGRHGSLSHFIPWLRARFELSADDRYSMLSGLAHDPLHRDLFTPLQTGAAVVIPDPDTMDEPGRLAAWMHRERVTVAHLTPALGQVLTTEAPDALRIEVPSLRYVFLVGDVLTRRDVARLRRLAPAVTCINYYGSTETQRAVGYHVAAEEGPREILPLGRGIPDVQILVLNPSGSLAGIGELGEISMRSPHIALGYLGDPQLTAQRFVGDLYRTGDLGRYLPNGEAVFVGRADTQVKIRGFRIELGEIEAVLGRFPGIREAVVIARQDRGPERYLAAYVVPASGASLATQELRAFLRERLPDSMVPATFTLLDELPLTPNRKVDRRALPAPEPPAGGGTFVAPRNPVEEVLAGLWAEVLGVERVGIDDSFFELGGHSLLATRLLARIRDAFGCDLPLRELFASPTIAGLAARIEPARAVGSPPGAPPLCRAAVRPAELPLSFAQERFWLLEQLQPGGAYHIPFAVRLLGHLDVAALAAALAAVVRRHEALRTAFPRRNGRPVQVVLPPAAPALPIADLAGLPAAARETEALRLAQETVRRPFDLERGPLLRALLVRLGESEHVASLAVHHAVFDGWSAALFIDELAILYAAARTGLPARLPELPVQAGDHALWQRDWLRGEALAMQRDVWRRTLAGAPPAVALPADPLPSGARPEAVEVRSALAPAAVHALRQQAQACGATLFMALLAGLDALLYRWTGQEDLVIGTVLAERDRPPLERLIGCFVNFLPLRVRLDGGTSWRQVLERARDAALTAHAHRDLPFEEIANAAGTAREPGRNPLYNVALLLQNVPGAQRFDASLEAHLLPLPSPGALLDLRLVAQESEDGGLALRWEANGEICAPATVESLAAAYETMLAHLVAAPDEPVAAADLPWPGQEALARTAEPAQRRVTVAATFTADPVERALRFWIDELDLPLDVALAPYGQLFQELVSTDGLFARNRGGFNVGLVRLEDWRRPGESDPWSGVVRAAADLARAARGAAERTGTPLLLCLCPTSPRTLANPAAASAVQRGEEQLAADLAGIPGVHLVTAADLAALYPVAEPHDPRGDELGHVPYTPAYFSALGTLVARRIWRLLTPPHKVIAVDCDQTLWKGVCGEDGPLGIEIDPPRRALQELLVAQREAGMLLCLCSKNSEADVEAVFRLRSDMPLRREHIAATSVSWQPKSQGLRALAAELGLGLDSFIFLDDNPLEHAEVEAEHPEILTLLLPEDPEEIPGFLRHVWAFDHLEVTEEDRRRAESYRQNRERERLREAGMTLEEFLAELELEVEIGPIAAAHLPRVAQLTQRTNQFNLTTIRRSEPEIAGLLASGASEGRMVHVRDRFGDYGLVGVLLFTAGPRALEVDTLLLSCRALGRRVEHRMVAALGELSLERGLERVDLRFAATERNRPAADFLEAVAGDVRHSAGDGGWVFRLPAGRAAALAGAPAALATASPEEVDHV